MRVDAFAKPGRFYRGNLHTHTTRSDGRRTADQVVGDYRARGYDFVSLTDHFLPNERFHPGTTGFCTVTDARHHDGPGFVTIPGAELHGPALENGDLWHIVAAGLPVDFAPLREGETGPEIARRARDAGAFIGIAHPYWSSITEADALSIVDLADAVEIYNHGCEVEVMRGDGLHMAEVILMKGHRLTLYAADDAHFKHARGTFVDAFGAWVMVKADALSPDAILAALKVGDYYSSTGPEIHDIAIDGDTIRIECSPVDSIVVSGRGAVFHHVHDVSTICHEGRLPAPDRTPYVRVTVIDAQGRRAWSNPIWLADRA